MATFQPAERELRVHGMDDDGSFLISLDGDLDIAGLAVMRLWSRVAVASRAPRVIVDLGGLTLLDSTGMRALLDLDECLEAAGRQLLLVPGTPATQSQLHTSGLLRILRFVDDA